MSKFRRVSETQGIPQYLDDGFSQQGEKHDPYKELRQGQQDRQVKIASQQMDVKRVAKTQNHEWERHEAQQTFVQPSMMREFDDQLSRFSAADLSTQSIRRMDTGYDEGMNTRSVGQNLFVTESDAIDLIRRGASMWNTDFDDISRLCTDAMDSHDYQFQKAEQQRAARREKHNKWEKKSRRELLGRGNTIERAGAVVRNSFANDYTCESSFGLPNYDSVLNDETERLKRIKESREERLKLQRRGYSPEDRQETWEEHATRAVRASRFQDKKIDWVDGYVRRYSEDAENDIDLSR